MKMQAWVDSAGMRRHEIAAALDVSEAHLSRLINGQRTPGSRLLARIEQFTQGAVRVSDFFEAET